MLDLDTFLYNLQFEPEKISPPDWHPDWEDAPLPYKLYRGLPEIPLNADVPFTLTGRDTNSKPSLEEVGHFLWYIYGLTRYAQTAFMEGTDEKVDVSYVQFLRRFVPSGGALYPSELYVYLKLEEIPEGIYHYDVAHHRLLLVREGNYDSYLSRSLGNRYDLSDSFCTVFVSTVFWKNFYKYNNFSYRLQGLDAGVLIGQSLEVAGRLGFSARVCYQFLDRSVNHLLGLSEKDESVYAVIPLSLYHIDQYSVEENITASELSQEIPSLKHVTYNRSKRVIDYPMLKEMNEASMIETTQAFVNINKEHRRNLYLGTEMIMLPFTEDFSYDLASVLRERHSPDIDFMIGKVSQTKISTLLKETFSYSYHNDFGNDGAQLTLFGSFYNVEGVPDGVYSYDKSAHALRRISKGDFREYMQNGLTMPNLNLYQVPLCLHIVGNKDHLKKELGYRGYRIQQMEAGIRLQRLLLTGCALEMGGHPLLGFNANQSDELYRINSEGKTSLIQIPVGPYHPRVWLKGTLNS